MAPAGARKSRSLVGMTILVGVAAQLKLCPFKNE